MKKLLFLLLLVASVNTSIAQKIKFKDDMCTVDGVDFLHWEKRSAGTEVSVWGMNADGEELFIMYLDYADPNKITKSNPEGKVRWIELNFLGLKQKCEIDSRGHKGLIKFIIANKIYVDGNLSAENVERLIQKYGMRFSEGKPNNVNININHN